MTRPASVWAAGSLAAALVVMGAPAGADDGPGLDPATVDLTLRPGQSAVIEKQVRTPELPPMLDMCLVVDLSGSYVDDLENIKDVAPGLWDALLEGGVGSLRAGLASFVDFPIPPWGTTFFPDHAYRLEQDLTADRTTWLGAVDALATLDGGDVPESQYEALHQLATGAGNDIPGDVGDVPPGQGCSFRDDATRVAVLTTDAAFHDAGDGGGPFPYPGASAADATAALQGAGIRVIGLKAPGAGGELDALAAATGGTTVPTSADSSDIAEAILEGLGAITVDVSMTSDCADTTGGVIDTTFTPATQTVEAGEHVLFTETISVSADAPGGLYHCRDWALLDGEPMTDAAGAIIYERKTVLVPENHVTGGGHATDGRGSDRSAVHVGGNAGYRQDGSIVGQWTFVFREPDLRIRTTRITELQFSDSGGTPAPPAADADTVAMVATARVRVGNGPWQEGCTVHAVFVDGGEPQEDTLGVDVDCGSGAFVREHLSGGNIQIHDGTRG